MFLRPHATAGASIKSLARIVLNTFGSFGDIHPYLAIAIELQRRGHECIIATSEVYRRKITTEGVAFAPVRPDVGELLNQPDLIRKLWHPRNGTIYLIRDYLLPKVEQSYADLNAACNGADLLLTHAAAYAGPIVAQQRSIPWLSVALQPAIFFSTYEPWAPAPMPWTRHLAALGRWPFALMLKAVDRRTRRWAQPIFQLRRRLGLSASANPIMHGQFSPHGTLTLFSSRFAPSQPDWPAKSQPTGFVFYDKRGEGFGLPPEENAGISPALAAFLKSGPPPVLFTLGSSAVTNPGAFYIESAAAARQLGIRAVLLTGKPAEAGAAPVSDGVVHSEAYAPYSAIMPLVSAVVHQGGIGTVGQTLQAGKPMIVVPWAHDQPDNGYRLERLGVGLVIARGAYRKARAARGLHTLLSGSFSSRAKEMATTIRQEDGLTAACDRIDSVLRG